MSRFKNEFAKMETLTSAARSDTQTLAALLALVCFLLILWTWGFSPDEAAPASPAVGLLSKWIVTDAASSQAGCQQAACEYLVVHPVSDMPATQVLARHLPPPTEELMAPDGYLFHPQRHSGPVYTRSRLPVSYPGYVPWMAVALPVPFAAKLGATLSSVVNLRVSSPGYVPWTKPPAQAASGKRPPVDASGVSHIPFQPFHAHFQVQLDAPPPYPVASDDTLAVRFLDGAESQTIRLPLASAFEPVRVIGVQADPAGRGWKLYLAMRDDDQALKVLNQRMSMAQLSDAPALATSIVLGFRLKHEAGTPQPMRLPATAVIRQGAQSRVWLALEGTAVPVTVKELQRLPDSVLVSEVAGARGLPIEHPDWLALGARLRCDSLRSASAQSGRDNNNRLLTTSAAVIVQPDAALRPATAVKVRYAPADTRPDAR